MTITLMLLLSNSHLLAANLPPAPDRDQPESGFVTVKAGRSAGALHDQDRAIELRRSEDERPYAL